MTSSGGCTGAVGSFEVVVAKTVVAAEGLASSTAFEGSHPSQELIPTAIPDIRGIETASKAVGHRGIVHGKDRRICSPSSPEPGPKSVEAGPVAELSCGEPEALQGRSGAAVEESSQPEDPP